jgi:hypothetical protein
MREMVSFQIWQARLAWLLSGLLSPFVLVPFFAAFLILDLTATRWEFLKLYLLCVGCSAGVPAAYIGYNVYSGRITDMHVKLLEQRRGPFLAGLGGLALQATGLWLVGAPYALSVYATAILLNAIIFAYISQAWKISVHTGGLSACLAGAIPILGWSPWWLVLQIPLIWARAHRKRHHPWQGLGGALLGFFPIWIALQLLL